MRVLGIDHGTVRMGLAMSDEAGVIARPFEAVAAADALRRIPEVVREQGIGAIVLGLPLRLDGTEGPAAGRVRGFLDALRPLVPADIPIHLRDESLTTIEAEARLRSRRRPDRRTREDVDRFAAAVILQEFLDELNGPPPLDTDE
jgi:putative Holliday junction resolvase